MFMMLFQQLQLYQQQSDNQYAQMNIGQEIANIQDQTSIFEQNMGAVDDVVQLGFSTTMQVSNQSMFASYRNSEKELNEFIKQCGDSPTDAQIAEINSRRTAMATKQQNAHTAQNAFQMTLANMANASKRISQAMRDAMMAPLKMKEKRLQTQLKTLEAQGTFIDKRLEKVEKQLESSIKDMTPGFGVSQG